jgi:large subunit ribosomal protein L6
MSRIGRKPIAIPAGVTVTVDGNNVTVTGPKGTLNSTVNPAMNVAVEGATVVVSRPDDDAKNRSLHGLTRTLIANMVEGVTNGYSKKLEIVGVGYRCQMQGKDILLNIGFSHPVVIKAVDGLTFETPDQNTIIVSGADKQLVGQTSAEIRSIRKPEPYHGKGIKYSDEHIRRKAGKAGK